MKLRKLLKGSSTHPLLPSTPPTPDPQCTARTQKPGRPRCTLPKAAGRDTCAVHSRV